MMIVGHSGITCAFVLVTSGIATADQATQINASSINVDNVDMVEMTHRWPSLPQDTGLSLEDQITDHLSELGNLVGSHMTFLSHDMFGLHIYGRQNRARLRVGGGDARYLEFRLDSDWLFADGKARIHAKVDLGIAGHMLHVELPDMDLSEDSYHGTQLVQVNVPLLERRF
jgi:hypothetical protein